MSGTYNRLAAIATAALLTSSISPVLAATRTWNVNGNGNWNTAGNWSTALPTGSDDVVFSTAGFNNNKVITFDTSITNLNAITFNNTAATTIQNDVGGVRTLSFDTSPWVLINKNAGAVTFQSVTSGGGSLTVGGPGSGGYTFTNYSQNTFTIGSTLELSATASRDTNIIGKGATVLSGPIINAGDLRLTPLGSAEWTLSSTGTTATGSIFVNSGKLKITGTTTSAMKLVAYGEVAFDLSAGDNRWNSAGDTTLGGGKLSVKGPGTGTSVQTLGNIVLDSKSTIVVNPNGGSTTTLAVGTFARTSGGTGTVLIDLTAANSVLTTTSVNAANSLINATAFALVKDSGGLGFATVNAGSVQRYTGGVALTPASNLGGNTNYIITNGGTQTLTGANATQSASTLDIRSTDVTGGANRLELNGKTLSAPVFLFTGDKDYSIINSTPATGGISNLNTVHHYGSGVLSLDAKVTGATFLTLTGGGTLRLTNTANTNTGRITIQDGTLEAFGTALGTGALQFGGGVLQSSGTFNRSFGNNTNQVRWNERDGVQTGTGGGFAARTGDLFVQLNAGTAAIAWDATSFVQAGKALVFGSTSADRVVYFQNGLGLGAQQREIRVIDNPAVTTDKAVLDAVITSTNANGELLKTGDGVLELTNANTYSGDTTIRAGTLLVNNTTGSATGTGTVSVQSGAKLGGAGMISGAVTLASGATLAPGNSPGTLTTGDLTLVAGSTFAVELTGAGAVAGTDYDQVNVNGTVDLGASTLSLSASGFSPTMGQLIYIVRNNGTNPIGSTFDSLANNTVFTAAGTQFKISYFGNADAVIPTFEGGNDVVLQVVPEPVSLSLFASSLLFLTRRRSR